MYIADIYNTHARFYCPPSSQSLYGKLLQEMKVIHVIKIISIGFLFVSL